MSYFLPSFQTNIQRNHKWKIKLYLSYKMHDDFISIAGSEEPLKPLRKMKIAMQTTVNRVILTCFVTDWALKFGHKPWPNTINRTFFCFNKYQCTHLWHDPYRRLLIELLAICFFLSWMRLLAIKISDE